MSIPTNPRDAITAILAMPGNEELTDFGYGIFSGTVAELRQAHGPGTPAFAAAHAKVVAQQRALLFEQRALEGFTAALTWLRTLAPIKIPTLGSYGLKHVTERVTGTYVTNGAFICAAFAAGLAVKRDPQGPNAAIGISKRSIAAFAA